MCQRVSENVKQKWPMEGLEPATCVLLNLCSTPQAAKDLADTNSARHGQFQVKEGSRKKFRLRMKIKFL